MLALVAAAAGAAGCERAAPRDGPRRIVLILVDTLRRDHVGAYGGPVATPHIDSLASAGLRVDDALSAYHMTSMSMSALFTGRTPAIDVASSEASLPWNDRSWCGLARFAASADHPCIPSSVPTLGERLSAAGWETIGVASNAMLHGDAGFRRGFDRWVEVARVEPGQPPERGSAVARTGAQVVEATREALAGRQSDHFFLYVHFMDVHDYFDFNEGRDRLDFPGLYADAVARQDRAIGALLELFDAHGLREGTTFVLTSDHGEHLGEPHPVKPDFSHAGNPSYDTLLRVPLLIAPAPPEPLAAPVQARDLHRLLLRMAGVRAAPEPEPEALLRPEELYVSELRWRTLRSGRFKWMERRDGRRALLFDLAEDPAETRDVARREAVRARALRQRVHALAAALAAAPREDVGLDAEERARLRALGYAH